MWYAIFVRIVFSDHANSQRIERKIPKQYILSTLKFPQKKLASFKHRQLLQKELGGRILEVVAIIEDDILTVITQYWVEGK